MISVSKSGRKSRSKGSCHVCGKDHAFWFNEAKQGYWYLSIPDATKANGYRQERLSQDHDEAKAMWHRLEGGLPVETTNNTTLLITAPEAPAPISALHTPHGEEMLVGELAGLFLENVKLKISDSRYRITKRYLDDLCRYMGRDSIAKVRIGGVARVEKWLADHTTWDGCLRSVVSRVKQVFKWGADQGYFASSPIKALARPKDNTRVAVLTEEQVKVILEHSPFKMWTKAFKVLLATGCRPEEFCNVEAKDVRRDESGEIYWWVKHKNMKHTGQRRRVYLPSEIQEMTKEAMKVYPTGKLFRNRVGSPWSPEYLNIVFRKITAKTPCVALGLNKSSWASRRLPNGKIQRFRKFETVVYVARHTFAHRLLTGFYKDGDGRPLILNYAEIATYMGNSAAEVERTYGHLAKATTHLSSRLRGVSV